jgi:hypothetical protein
MYIFIHYHSHFVQVQLYHHHTPFHDNRISAMTTPSKKRVTISDADHMASPESMLRAIRAKKGNDLDNLKSESDVLFVQSTLKHLADFPGDKDLINTHMAKLRAAHAVETVAATNMTQVIGIRTLRDVPEAIAIQWVLDNSDLKLADITLAQTHAKDIQWILLSAGTGFSMCGTLPRELQQLQLFLRFCNYQRDHSGGGTLLKTIKALSIGKMSFSNCTSTPRHIYS